jgi:hypothetical protein
MLMSGVMTLSPPIEASVEVETVCFDYGLLLQDESLTITSVLSMDCSTVVGEDANAATRLVGSAVIGSSRETGALSGSVLQQVGYMVAGVTYLLHCVAGISDGQRLSLSARLACTAVYGYSPPDAPTTAMGVGAASGAATATAVGYAGTAGGVPTGLLLSLMS